MLRAGDVVGQQHDFVGEQAVLVSVGSALGMRRNQVDDEVAGAGAGVENDDVRRGQRDAESVFSTSSTELHM